MQTIKVFHWEMQWILGPCLGVALALRRRRRLRHSIRRPPTIRAAEAKRSTSRTWGQLRWQHVAEGVSHDPGGAAGAPRQPGGHQVIVRPARTSRQPVLRPPWGARCVQPDDRRQRRPDIGSGATGWVIVDSSCPGVAVRTATELSSKYGSPPFKIIQSDQPESGLKSVDWWDRCDAHRTIRRTIGTAGFGATSTPPARRRVRLAMTDRTGVELSG